MKKQKLAKGDRVKTSTVQLPCCVCKSESESDGGFCEECDNPTCAKHTFYAHGFGFCCEDCADAWISNQ